MNQEQLAQLTRNIKATFKKLSVDDRDVTLDLEKIEIIFNRVVKACDNNRILAVKLIDFALKSNILDKYGPDHQIWNEFEDINKLFDTLEEYAKTTI